jgi:hypothetical protein
MQTLTAHQNSKNAYNMMGPVHPTTPENIVNCLAPNNISMGGKVQGKGGGKVLRRDSSGS